MTNYTITGKSFKKVNHGLVNYVVEGYIERDAEKIPCEIGFIYKYENPTHIFIKNGITENGTHYYAETIEI